MKNPVVFLDRDGTLIEEVNFLSRTEDLRFFPFTVQAIDLLKNKGYLIIVVTNQSGIGRGIFEEKAMHEIHAEIQRRLNNKIDAFYFCPHLPDAGCACRKPKAGMIRQAAKDFSIDLDESWMIGDKALDVETGFNAKTKTALVLTGYGEKDFEKLNRKPDLVAENLFLAVEGIIK
ncbi:MAG: HAD family hydrolase [Acidobacteriota bacterium]|nr:HAD family hydrolase [Acidobacteriota bacterium]